MEASWWRDILDSFPFPYYLIVHHLDDLPGALAGLLEDVVCRGEFIAVEVLGVEILQNRLHFNFKVYKTDLRIENA